MKRHFSVLSLITLVLLIFELNYNLSVIAQATSAIPMIAANPAGEAGGDVWGGQHIEMKQNASGAEIEFDCATGTIAGPLKVDAQGKFQADGTYRREHGGPVKKDENGAAAAKYSGSITGDTMHLDIVLTQSKESVGSYVLTRGQAGTVFKCK